MTTRSARQSEEDFHTEVAKAGTSIHRLAGGLVWTDDRPVARQAEEDFHTEIAARLSRNHRGGGFAARHVGEPQPLVVVERDG
jgi:hypothetical protein